MTITERGDSHFRSDVVNNVILLFKFRLRVWFNYVVCLLLLFFFSLQDNLSTQILQFHTFDDSSFSTIYYIHIIFCLRFHVWRINRCHFLRQKLSYFLLISLGLKHSNFRLIPSKETERVTSKFVITVSRDFEIYLIQMKLNSLPSRTYQFMSHVGTYQSRSKLSVGIYTFMPLAIRLMYG